MLGQSSLQSHSKPTTVIILPRPGRPSSGFMEMEAFGNNHLLGLEMPLQNLGQGGNVLLHGLFGNRRSLTKEYVFPPMARRDIAMHFSTGISFTPK